MLPTVSDFELRQDFIQAMDRHEKKMEEIHINTIYDSCRVCPPGLSCVGCCCFLPLRGAKYYKCMHGNDLVSISGHPAAEDIHGKRSAPDRESETLSLNHYKQLSLEL